MKKWLTGIVMLSVLAIGAFYIIASQPADMTAILSDKAAHVEIINTKGEKIGTAVLAQKKNGVKIMIQASHLPPGEHGFHIHEYGVCEPPDFKTAGEHFNPEGKQHGFKNPKGPHLGDLPNLKVKQDGSVRAVVLAKNVTLEEGKPNSIAGRALMIHANPDDYATDPAGNAGARIACGVIPE